MNNEPVAWAMFVNGNFYDCISPEEHARAEGSYTIPLYTHPAKTLTDEEIDAVGDEVSNLIDTYAGRREFARAILRKAQEK